MEVGKAHGAVNGKDLGFAVDISELVVMRSKLDPAAIADHELDLSGDGGGRRDFIGDRVVVAAVVRVDLARSGRGVAGVGVGGVRVALHLRVFLNLSMLIELNFFRRERRRRLREERKEGGF